jgi:septal ring factor EnvC (AmiA/AmiB activator)
METVAKAPATPKPTDRMMEALATLAALLDRTINEVKVLDADFQKRITEAVQKKEEAIRTDTAKMVEAARSQVHEDLTARFHSELQSALDALRAEFQAERERWSSESGVERERLNKELQLAGNTASELQVERSKLTAELQRVKEDSAAEISRLRAAAEAASAAAAKAAKATAPGAKDEIERMRAKLAEVTSIIDDPVTELSVVIRKNVEKLELEAYLRGLRYSEGK